MLAISHQTNPLVAFLLDILVGRLGVPVARLYVSGTKSLHRLTKTALELLVSYLE